MHDLAKRPETMSAQRIALWADRLRDIAAMGLRFSEAVYDRERYQAIQDLGMEMLAAATAEPIEELEPLRATIFSRPTPFSVGDAAVINDNGEILLIRRADNHKWAMPGGALEVGETPAQGVVREAFEETGVRCEPVALVGVFDSRLCGSETRHHLYHLLFLCRPFDNQDPSEPSHAHEVLGTQWFAEDRLPDDIDRGHISRIPEAFRVWRHKTPAFFDQ